MDRGPKKTESHIPERPSEILGMASHDVISLSPSMTIKQAAAMMQEHDVRRLPVIDAGSRRLKGMITAIDILDFMGGGPKYNIILQDHGGNFLKAVNSGVSKIMRQSLYLEPWDRPEKAARLMVEKRSSCLPVIESEEEPVVVGIITEHDILPKSGEYGVKVSTIMNPKPITATRGMMLSDVAKVMVRNQVRRLPVISEDKLVGMVTVFDILKYLESGEYKGVFAEENLSTRVGEIMEPRVIKVSPDDDAADITRLIMETGRGGFPVALEDELLGIVTATDILRWVQTS